jgi:hypothetical protein
METDGATTFRAMAPERITGRPCFALASNLVGLLSWHIKEGVEDLKSVADYMADLDGDDHGDVPTSTPTLLTSSCRGNRRRGIDGGSVAGNVVDSIQRCCQLRQCRHAMSVR